NLYEGIAIQTKDIGISTLSAAEIEEYQQDPGAYLPPIPGAAHLRVPLRNIPAGVPLRAEYFEDLELPEGPIADLAPGMRAVNVSVLRERAAGGLIKKGDRVDVMLTTNIGTPLPGAPSVR